MPDRKDLAYFAGRAASERAIAAASDSPAVAAVHEELADRYERLAAGPTTRRRMLHLVAAKTA